MTNAREYPLSSLWDTAVVVISTIIGLIALAAGLEGFFKTHVNVISRVILIISAIMLVIPEPFTDVIGLSIAIVMFILNYLKWKKNAVVAS